MKYIPIILVLLCLFGCGARDIERPTMPERFSLSKVTTMNHHLTPIPSERPLDEQITVDGERWSWSAKRVSEEGKDLYHIFDGIHNWKNYEDGEMSPSPFWIVQFTYSVVEQGGYEGDVVLNGYQCHHFRFEVSDYEFTEVFLDTVTNLPVRFRAVSGDIDAITDFSNLELNPAIDSETFSTR